MLYVISYNTLNTNRCRILGSLYLLCEETFTMMYLSLNYFSYGCSKYCTIKICHCLMVSKDSADCLHFLKGKVLLLTVFEWENMWNTYVILKVFIAWIFWVSKKDLDVFYWYEQIGSNRPQLGFNAKPLCLRKELTQKNSFRLLMTCPYKNYRKIWWFYLDFHKNIVIS